MNLFIKISISILFLILTINKAFTQTDVFNVQVEQNPKEPFFGINNKYFNHYYFGLHFNSNFEKQNAQNFSLRSPKYFFGWKHILKLNNFFAINADFELSNSFYCIKQNEFKVVPDTLKWDKQRLIQNQLSSAIFLRINFDKRRGNYMGHYLDLGFKGTYNYTNIHFTKIENKDRTVSKMWRYNPNYFERFNYGPALRIGIKRYVFSANYNLSGVLKDNYFTSDFTPFSLGLEIGLHK